MNPVLVLEAAPGPARRRVLEDRLAAHRAAGGEGWLLDVRFWEAGPWAGLVELFGELLPRLRAESPDLVTRHASELAYVLPAEKKALGVRNMTLTDLAPPDEKVRNYPADRAYRVVHGLVDLLAAWKRHADPGTPWMLACEGFEDVSHIGGRFFGELARRSDALLAVAVSPEGVERTREVLHDLDLRTEALPGADENTTASSAGPSPEEALKRGLALEEEVGFDEDAIEVWVAELIRLFRRSGDRRKEFRWLCRGLETYNSLGFYEDALEYGYRAWDMYREFDLDHEDLRWALLVKMFMSNVGLQRGEEAYRLVEESRMLELPIPLERRSQLCYLVAMLYVRYFPDRDLSKGEEYLEQGLRDLEAADMVPEDHHFYYVFNRNGLALVRHFQGRYEEAIELCRAGYQELEEHLTGEKHRLHRSVLLYNIGQVYAAMGELEEAVAHYSAALDMDPTYSEYYNDRGSLYLRLGRLEEAKADYLQAIELSPPYHEVWTNLGQCHRLSGEMNEAARAYSRALELKPDHFLARLGRAQSVEALGYSDHALADYEAAHRLRDDAWEPLAGRAVLRYERGELDGSLADLDRAIELAPDNADLYQNRSVALADLGQEQRAVGDLRRYLELQPEAEDRSWVEERIRELEGAAAVPAE